MIDINNIIDKLRNLPHVFSTAEAVTILAQHYKAPLKALEGLEHRNTVVRIRRGQYALRAGFDPMLGANLIHAPSYVSYETALAFYGLIPERVELILSVVDGRPLDLKTTVGDFSYLSQSRRLFALGFDLLISPHGNIAIANREKAVLDTLARAKLRTISASPAEILEYAVDGLRMDEAELKKLSVAKLKAMAPLYRNLAQTRFGTFSHIGKWSKVMNDALRAMLRAYAIINSQNRQTDQINALREVIQRITLLGLHRGGFFDKASFYGGTALRILYDLDRFSEDLDFCLTTPDPDFQLSKFFDSIEAEHARFGLHPILQERKSGTEVNIESAFVKQDTCKGLLVIGGGIDKIPKGQTLKVRIEVDKANPPGAIAQSKIIATPIPFMVGTLTESSLFAGKLHAILARAYLNRTKGRDYYDFVFYSSRGTPVNLQYLEAKLRDSGHIVGTQALTLETLIDMLKTKFSKVDFESAKEDVRPFIKPEKRPDLAEWSAALFSALAERLRAD